MDLRINKHSVFTLITVLVTAYFAYALIATLKELRASEYGNIQVIYSFDQRADLAVVEQIEKAQKFVYFAIYTLTREDIASALIAAKMRGLDVRGVLDYNQTQIPEEKPWVNKLKKYGVIVYAPEKEEGLMHIKMLVTDNGYASGSFNWTTSGTLYNDEVLETGNNERIRLKYLEIFKKLEQKYSK